MYELGEQLLRGDRRRLRICVEIKKHRDLVQIDELHACKHRGISRAVTYGKREAGRTAQRQCSVRNCQRHLNCVGARVDIRNGDLIAAPARENKRRVQVGTLWTRHSIHWRIVYGVDGYSLRRGVADSRTIVNGEAHHSRCVRAVTAILTGH